MPITKEDIRAIAISKLRLREGLSAIDVGCGSGSITVELCLQTRGPVYAIDFEADAIDLTKKNLEKFGVTAEVILGKAQDVLPRLPQVDAIIVGGTWGDATQIIRPVEVCSRRQARQGQHMVHSIRNDSEQEIPPSSCNISRKAARDVHQVAWRCQAGP